MYLVRNRRLTYLSQLEKEHYFSEENMKLRQPSLYYQYIGKYKKQKDDFFKPFDDNMKISGFFYIYVNFYEIYIYIERLLLNCDLCKANEIIEKENIIEEEEDDDEDDEDENKEENNKDNQNKENENLLFNNEKIDYNEFISIMKEYFLEGLDKDFIDYNRIDNDETLDNIQEIDRDEQEKYFDSD